MSSAFQQPSPLQSLHTVTHLSSCFQLEHKFVPQGFLEESLHLHHTNFSTSVSGVAAMPVIVRDRIFPSESSV